MIATTAQIVAAFNVLRKDADASGYGQFITNDKLQVMAVEIANAVVAVAEKPQPT